MKLEKTKVNEPEQPELQHLEAGACFKLYADDDDLYITTDDTLPNHNDSHYYTDRNTCIVVNLSCGTLESHEACSPVVPIEVAKVVYEE